MSAAERADHDAQAPLPEGEEAPPRGVHAAAVVRWALIAVMALVAALSVLSYAGMLPAALRSDGGNTAAAIQYVCPMHPAVVRDEPGDCPICGMRLVPRDSGATVGGANAAGANTAGAPDTGASTTATAPLSSDVPGLAPIELTPERIQLIGMRTATARRATLDPELRTTGYVAPTEDGLAQVQTRFAGWIEELRVAQTGARVRRGEVLATIYSPVLLSTQQELLTARRWSGTGDAAGGAGNVRASLLDGARRRLELAGMSADDIRQVERTGKPMRAVAVRAPIDGYIIEKNAVHGLYVEPGTKLFEIADLSTVWVLADVYEYEVGRVREGVAARLTLAAYPDKSFDGRVDFVYPTLNAQTRTLRVRLVFPNPGLQLRPGMYGDVFIALPESEGLLVPRDAIVDTGEHQYVFLARAGGRFEPRLVTTGARSGDLVEVRSGVASGDVVVTTANFLLDSESRLRAAVTGGGGPAPASADCDARIDRMRFPEKWDECRACEVQHRGMGSMEPDCKDAIAKPWR